MEISQSESIDKINTGKCKHKHMDIWREILKYQVDNFYIHSY